MKPSYDGYKIKPLAVGWKRYLKPSEVELLIRAIPKYEYRVMFKSLLYTGCRYSELERLYYNQAWYMGGKILMKSEKPEAVHTHRFIQLNKAGQEAIEAFLKSEKPMPTVQTWTENLRRWAKRAHICDAPLDSRTLRRSWESWLAFMYPDCLPMIALSMGHNNETALKFYIAFPFDEEDKQWIYRFTAGFFQNSMRRFQDGLVMSPRYDCSRNSMVFGSTPETPDRDRLEFYTEKSIVFDNKTMDSNRNKVFSKTKLHGKFKQTSLIEFLDKNGKKPKGSVNAR